MFGQGLKGRLDVFIDGFEMRADAFEFLPQIRLIDIGRDRLNLDVRISPLVWAAARDCDDMLVSATEAEALKRNAAQQQQEAMQLQKDQIRAEIRKTLSDAFKNIAQGKKNAANADAAVVQSVVQLLERGLSDAADETGTDTATA